MATIGLCMIVKNEAHVILRCLESVKPLVDYVLIEDTGSTDGTQDVVRDWLASAGIDGDVIDQPWQDFAYNRSHVLARLREVDRIDYALMIDADDRLAFDPQFDPAQFKADLGHDFYDVEIRYGGMRYHRPQLVSNRLPFCFRSVLHEYLEAPPGELTRATAVGVHIEIIGGGDRHKNPTKYQDDAARLEQALTEETDPFLTSRYRFYLAQSYRDAGEPERALENYLLRAELGYWDEEIFISLYNAAKLKDALGYPEDDVIAAFLKATDVNPTRAEALHGAARYCRVKGRNEEGYQLARRGLAIAKPDGGLFVENWIYHYGLLDELAVNGYWSAHYSESLDACLKLLGGDALPHEQRERIAQNARFSAGKLEGKIELGTLGQSSLIDQHAIVSERSLRSCVPGSPKVLLAILAKQKEEMLPLYLECIEALDYPKESIFLYIRTNNNTDRTEQILREWVERVGYKYAGVEFDPSDVVEPVHQFGVHEWNATRFRVLGRIRNLSLERTLATGCQFYFVADVDNFIRRNTLRELVALNLPIVAPLLRSIEPGRFYSNYHADVDDAGYYRSCDQYQWILNRWIRGLIEVPVVHTTYLIRADVIRDLSYTDESDRYEYGIFSDSAQKAGIPQYLDNRQIYGYIVFGEGSEHHVNGGVEAVRALLRGDVGASTETSVALARAL